MSVASVRGGVPHVFRATVTTGGRKHSLPHFCMHLQIRVLTAPCKLYFTEADFTADTNYVLVPIPSTTTPYGEWTGPVEGGDVWLKGSGGSSDVELVSFQRRG